MCVLNGAVWSGDRKYLEKKVRYVYYLVMNCWRVCSCAILCHREHFGKYDVLSEAVVEEVFRYFT